MQSNRGLFRDQGGPLVQLVEAAMGQCLQQVNGVIWLVSLGLVFIGWTKMNRVAVNIYIYIYVRIYYDFICAYMYILYAAYIYTHVCIYYDIICAYMYILYAVYTNISIHMCVYIMILSVHIWYMYILYAVYIRIHTCIIYISIHMCVYIMILSVHIWYMIYVYIIYAVYIYLCTYILWFYLCIYVYIICSIYIFMYVYIDYIMILSVHICIYYMQYIYIYCIHMKYFSHHCISIPFWDGDPQPTHTLRWVLPSISIRPSGADWLNASAIRGPAEAGWWEEDCSSGQDAAGHEFAPGFWAVFFRLMVVSISSSTVHQPWDGSKTLMVLWVTFTRQLLVVLAACHRINPIFVSVATRSQLGTWGGPAGDWRRWNQGEGQGVVL